MGIRLKVNPLPMLKEKGYTTTRLFKEEHFGNATIQKFRDHGKISMNELQKLCRLLGCQPGDLLEYVPDEADPQQDDQSEE